MQDRHTGLLELIVVHRAVGGAEIHGFIQQLANSAAGTNRLIVNLHVRMSLMIDVEPLGIHRIRERRSGGVQQNLACGSGKCCNSQQNCKHGQALLRFALFLLEVRCGDSDSELLQPCYKASESGIKSANPYNCLILWRCKERGEGPTPGERRPGVGLQHEGRFSAPKLCSAI